MRPTEVATMSVRRPRVFSVVVKAMRFETGFWLLRSTATPLRASASSGAPSRLKVKRANFERLVKNASGVSQSSSGFIAGRSASVSSMRWRESVSFMKPASAVCTSPTSTTRVPADR